jgi:hypothetical protein
MMTTDWQKGGEKMKDFEERLLEMLGGTEESPEEAAERWAANHSLAIALDGVNNAIEHRFSHLAAKRQISDDGDWMSEFRETDQVMNVLHTIRNMLYDARISSKDN